MTDERMGDALWPALDRLPRGSGVVFRHHAMPLADRRHLFARVRRVTRRRDLLLIRGGATPMRGEQGTHNQRARGLGLRTFAAHRRTDLIAARRAGSDLVFVSPVFATRSHPEANGLGPVRLGLMIEHPRVPVVALGGMNQRRFRRLRGLGLWGWAGIDAWAGSTDQRRGSRRAIART